MADQEMQERQPIDLQKHSSGVANAPTLNNVRNVVSTMNWGCKLDLKAIALRFRTAVYNPKRCPFLITTIREPKTAALIHASGRMICIGAKSEHQSKLAARKYTRIIQKLGIPAKFEDFKIRDPNNVPKRLKGLIAYCYGASSSVHSVDEISKSIQQLTI